MFTDAAPSVAAPLPLDEDSCYRALGAHDARFDGSFFTGVTSTGIYCRPVCRVRLPRRENCRFFTLAAQAERAGFRPCLRCRPEMAPPAGPGALHWSTQDASAVLAHQAAQVLDDPDAWSTSEDADAPAPLARLAHKLGVSDRHLRRIFEAQWGVSPLQYWQTRRLLAAKQLLTDTTLPMAQVALASGYASLRRFNAAFVQHYGMAPLRLRKGSHCGGGQRAGAESATGALTGAVTVRLALRPPYDAERMLAFLGRRAVGGLETGDADGFARTAFLRVPAHGGSAFVSGWLHIGFDTARNHAVLRIADALSPALPALIRRVRALLDLDCDPVTIDALMVPHFPGTEGMRVPGAFDGFELAVRAVLGQQVTVEAGRTFATRLVQRYGQPVVTPWPALDRLFPSAAALAAADGDALGSLGIVRQRQAAIVALARAVDGGGLSLQAGGAPHATIAALRALPGIGDWTAQYIAMRALRWPDAFPAGDVALQKALGVSRELSPLRAAQAAEAASQAWRPWRSYAVLRAWQRPAGGTGPQVPATDPLLSKQ